MSEKSLEKVRKEGYDDCMSRGSMRYASRSNQYASAYLDGWHEAINKGVREHAEQLKGGGRWICPSFGHDEILIGTIACPKCLEEAGQALLEAGELWLCAGGCDQAFRGKPAAHNGSGPTCSDCEQTRGDNDEG